MLELGRIRRGGRRMTFREWAEALPENYEGGRYLVVALLNPSRYPSGAVVFSLGDGGSVKLSLKEETYKQLLRTFKFRRGSDRLGVRLFLVIDEELRYYVDSEEASDSEGYVVQNYGWKYTSRADESDDEVDF